MPARNIQMRLRTSAASFVVAVTAGALSPAQTWGAPFDHETIDFGGPVPNPDATDHLIPFGGYTNAGISYYNFAPTGTTFDWRGRMNAVHMVLIPKGPHRGKVLVWGATLPLVGASVLVRANGYGPPLQPNQFHSCAAWSIVDPAPTPAGPRFRNFLLPLEVFTPQPIGQPAHTASLFCAGQAHSPYGDLIVAGGTQFGVPTLEGANLVFAFNPRLPVRGWTGAGPSLYPGEFGLWEPGPNLVWDRFYPTTTLTARLSRLGGGTVPPREAILVAGGSVDDYSSDPTVNATWNNYEALVVSSEAALNSSGLDTDAVGGSTYWPGPGSGGTPPPVEDDWLEDYPRMHLLTDGQVMFSGYAPRWAMVDHDLTPGAWARQAAPPWSSTPWQHPRHDGSAVVFPNVGGLKDLVVRLGGSDEVNYVTAPNGTTPTVEAFVRQPNGGYWVSAGTMPNTAPGTHPPGRYLMNVVLLPDASLLVVGGVARAPGAAHGSYVNEPLLYKNGAWSVLPPNTTPPASSLLPSIRDYHATAILLPDGRVMIGGGNHRNFDYEVFSPAYMTLPKPQGVGFESAVSYDPFFDASVIGYDMQLEVKCADLPLGESLSKVVLMAPGATTHHFDMSQRYIEMATETLEKPHVIRFTTPLDDKHATRGIYMLFLVTSAGAVSDALWVVLR
jgi:hypothetical protein